MPKKLKVERGWVWPGLVFLLLAVLLATFGADASWLSATTGWYSLGDCISLARLSLSQYIDCMASLLGFRLFRLAFLSHAFQLLHDAFAEHLLHDLVSREFAHVLGEPVLLSALGGINHV